LWEKGAALRKAGARNKSYTVKAAFALKQMGEFEIKLKKIEV